MPAGRISGWTSFRWSTASRPTSKSNTARSGISNAPRSATSEHIMNRRLSALARRARMQRCVGADAARGGRFLRGKTITLAVGNTAGGGYDIYARLLGRYIGKYIPGRAEHRREEPAGRGRQGAVQRDVLQDRARWADDRHDGARQSARTGARQSRPRGSRPRNSPGSAPCRAMRTMPMASSSAPIRHVKNIAGRQEARTAAGARRHRVRRNQRRHHPDRARAVRSEPAARASAIRAAPISTSPSSAARSTAAPSASHRSRRPWATGGTRARCASSFSSDATRGWRSCPTCRRRKKRPSPRTRPLVDFAEVPFRIARPFIAPPKVPADRAAILKRAFIECQKRSRLPEGGQGHAARHQPAGG